MTLTQNLKKIKKPFPILLSAFILFISSSAFADFTKASTGLTNLHTALIVLAAVVIPVAVVYVGYKILFGGCGIMECWKPILGAVIIGAGPELSKLFF